MWKKGELVWVRLNPSDSWIPGRILDPSEPLGVLVSFFDLMEPRYVPKPCLRSFERDFETLVVDSWKFRHFVTRALETHFWNISFGLWCSCQPPIESPYLDRGYSLSCSPLSSDSALGFVRDMAVLQRVPLRRLAETNNLTAQILSFRRYNVDFNRSESIYEQVRESAKLMDRVEEPDWYLDPSYKMDCIDDMVSMFPETEDADSSDWSPTDPLPKDIHCCSVDKVVQSWNTRSTVISSMKACGTMARISNHEDAVNFETNVQVEEDKSAEEEMEDRNDHVEEENEKDVEDEKGYSETSDKEDETSKREEEMETDSRNSTLVGEEILNCSVRECWEVEQSSCLLNSEFPVEDIIEEDTTVTAQREAPPDVMIETHNGIFCSDDRTVTIANMLLPLLDASNDKAFLAKPVSFVVLEDRKNLACTSVEETSANPRSKLDSSMISASTLNEDRSDGNNLNGTRENCPEDALESHIVDVGQGSLHSTGSANKGFGSDDVGIAPAEQLQDLEVATAVKDKTSAVDTSGSIGVKRKASQDKASGKSKRRKKAGQQSISADKAQNLQLLKDKRFADPKCLRMKFLSTHVNLPSKSELLKRFSVFGKIDASRTDVNPGGRSAKVVFLQSIDAVTAYQFARSKKFKLGRSKVMYRLDAFEGDSEANKVPSTQKPQQSVPSPRSCLKKHGSVDKEEGRSFKVKFQMATNS